MRTNEILARLAEIERAAVAIAGAAPNAQLFAVCTQQQALAALFVDLTRLLADSAGEKKNGGEKKDGK